MGGLNGKQRERERPKRASLLKLSQTEKKEGFFEAHLSSLCMVVLVVVIPNNNNALNSIPIRKIMVEATVKTAVKKACNCECLYEPIWAKLRNLIEFDLSVALEFLVIIGKMKGKALLCIF